LIHFASGSSRLKIGNERHFILYTQKLLWCGGWCRPSVAIAAALAALAALTLLARAASAES